MGTQAEHQIFSPAMAAEENTDISIMVDEVVRQVISGGLDSSSSDIRNLHLQGPANEDLGAPLQGLIRALWAISFFTLILVISTALYQPATGVLFGRIKLLYYIALGAIFSSGVVEGIIAIVLSSGRNDIRRRFKIGRVVLFSAVVPLVAILGIGGSRFIKG